MEHYLERKDETIEKIIKAAYPDYAGRTIKISTDVPTQLDSFWTGGSREYYAFYELSTGKVLPVHSNHPGFEPGQPRKLDKLPQGIVLVNHSFFCGHDMGIRIYANPCDLTPLLPVSSESISLEEVTVLQYTSKYKNTYDGRTNIRFDYAQAETGISEEAWNAAKAQLIENKYLSKAGAIMPKGRNCLAGQNLEDRRSGYKLRNAFRKPSLPSPK